MTGQIPGDSRLLYFTLMTRTEQEATIVKMFNSGWTELGISAATKLSIEQIRRVIGQRREATRG